MYDNVNYREFQKLSSIFYEIKSLFFRRFLNLFFFFSFRKGPLINAYMYDLQLWCNKKQNLWLKAIKVQQFKNFPHILPIITDILHTVTYCTLIDIHTSNTSRNLFPSKLLKFYNKVEFFIFCSYTYLYNTFFLWVLFDKNYQIFPKFFKILPYLLSLNLYYLMYYANGLTFNSFIYKTLRNLRGGEGLYPKLRG